MNWEALGAIGEIVGAGGVIVSLLYLASQVRNNSRQMRHAAAQAVLAKLNGLIGQLAFTAGAGDVWTRGLGLDPHERFIRSHDEDSWLSAVVGAAERLVWRRVSRLLERADARNYRSAGRGFQARGPETQSTLWRRREPFGGIELA